MDVPFPLAYNSYKDVGQAGGGTTGTQFYTPMSISFVIIFDFARIAYRKKERNFLELLWTHLHSYKIDKKV